MACPLWNLDPYLHKVLRNDIAIDDGERKRTNGVLHAEIDEVIDLMKKDVVFMKLFSKLNYGGSTYENLKISKPNEFDLNIVLKLPFKKGCLKSRNCQAKPGFIFLIVDDVESSFVCSTDESVRRVVRNWFTPNGNMLRTKVYQWMQGVLGKVFPTYKISRKVEIHTFGPALTLIFDHPICGNFSVDMSPTIPFGVNEWPEAPVRHYGTVRYCSSLPGKNWYAVPKSPSPTIQDCPELWRISFYEFEKDIMNGLEHMKPTLKLMKFLRDKQGYKEISSYYLKTVFMWEQYVHEPSFWRKPLGELFIYMLCVIEKYLFDGWIPFYWHEDCNLLAKLSRDTTLNTSNRIKRMKKRILDNLAEKPEMVLAYFKMEITPAIENTSNTAFVKHVQEEITPQGWSCTIL